MKVIQYDEEVVFRLRALYERYGYRRYKMSKFEEYDLYVQNKNFLVSDHIITFPDTNGKLMALKPDVTLSIVKNSRPEKGTVQKVRYDENVYRVSKGTESYKELMQVGMECLGDIDAYYLSEVLSLAVKSLEEISPDYILDVSHLGMVSSVLDEMGVSAATRQALLTCLGEKNLHSMERLCREAGVDGETLLQLSALSGTPDVVLPQLKALCPMEEVQSLEAILSQVPSKNIRLDFSLVGDMNYYNGLVFSGFVSGIPARVLNGGQYDALMNKMGKTCGAVGFAVYLDLLEDLQKDKNDFDVDAVLLYDEKAAPAKVKGAVETLQAEGLRVTAQRVVPEKLRYGKLYGLTESGVQELENHA